MGRIGPRSFCSRTRDIPLRRPKDREENAVPAAKKNTIDEEVVFLAVRIPKSLKRELQQAALDEESTVQALVRSAIQSELGKRTPLSRPARTR